MRKLLKEFLEIKSSLIQFLHCFWNCPEEKERLSQRVKMITGLH